MNGSSVLPRQALRLDSVLTLPNAGHAMEGNYSCHDQGGALIHAVPLRLGRKTPSPLLASSPRLSSPLISSPLLFSLLSLSLPVTWRESHPGPFSGPSLSGGALALGSIRGE